ncbi:MAG: DUF1858 domain-containing protein [Bacteroidales bacterium]
MITPKTKILDLLTEYPALEEVLFEISPAFKQLKNPVLRRTVARVTTLQQAAIVGGIRVEDLVNRLRKAAGLEEPGAQGHEGTGAQGHQGTGAQGHQGTGAPEWFDANRVTKKLDAREMLNRGEHPVAQVLADLHTLPRGEIYELTAPFNPAPLIDKATGLGYRHWINQVADEEFRVYFSS